MKFHIVVGSFDYEGGMLLGLYSTEELANKRREALVEQSATFDTLTVLPVELDQDLEIDV